MSKWVLTPSLPHRDASRQEREGGEREGRERERERNRHTDRDSAYVYSLLTDKHSDRNERTDVYSSLTDRHSDR